MKKICYILVLTSIMVLFTKCVNSSAENLSSDAETRAKIISELLNNPDDQSVLYAISSTKFNMKGVLVNGYGISANTSINAIISKLDTHPDKPK